MDPKKMVSSEKRKRENIKMSNFESSFGHFNAPLKKIFSTQDSTEYVSRAELLRQNILLEKQLRLGSPNRHRMKSQIHVGLLYASPILYTDINPETKKKGFVMTPQLKFNKEKEVIKE